MEFEVSRIHTSSSAGCSKMRMARESMPRGAFQDSDRCLHFADDWNEGADVAWEDVYLDKKNTRRRPQQSIDQSLLLLRTRIMKDGKK